MQSKFSTIVFDFDGTIADSFWVLFDIFDEKREEFKIRVIDKDEVTKFRSMSMLDVLREVDVPLFRLPFFIKIFRDEMNERIKGVSAFDYMDALLRHLKEKGFILGILSSNSKDNVETFLENNGLLNVMDFVYEDDSVFFKNRTMHKLLEEHSLESSEVLYVGDQVRDIVASQKVNIPVAAVTWGYNSKEILSEANPTYLADTPQELEEIICSSK